MNRAPGYKTHHIFYVLALEYLTAGLACTVVGAALWEAAGYFAVTPYLDQLFGGTIMSMKLQLDPAAAVILLACLRAAVKSNKIEPVVLLCEG